MSAALDRAAGDGRRVRIWWRDDDAETATPALDRLLALAVTHGAPILVAAIPAGAAPSLARRIAEAPATVALAVHGLAHADHAPRGEKPAEFGAHRPLTALVADTAEGLRLARERLPDDRLLPVFVPPWNRVAPELAAALPGIGFSGLSAGVGPAVPGLRRADATLDPIDWRGTRSLRPPTALIDWRGTRSLHPPTALIDALVRHVATCPERPIGLLTHHRVHDEAVWSFLGALLTVLRRHPAVAFLDPRDVFDAGASAAVDGPGPKPTSHLSPPARTG